MSTTDIASSTAAGFSADPARLRAWKQRLLGFTIAWNSVEAVVAAGAGVAAGSVALVGFGLDSLVEVFAAGVAMWHVRGGLDERREQLALRLIGVSFFAVAAYVVAEGTRDLLVDQEAGESVVGIVLAAVSLVVMPTLAVIKRRLAVRLGSAALRAESAETFLCSALSAVLLAGLVINATLGWWWADTLAALVIAALAVREGLEAWQGDHDEHT